MQRTGAFDPESALLQKGVVALVLCSLGVIGGCAKTEEPSSDVASTASPSAKGSASPDTASKPKGDVSGTNASQPEKQADASARSKGPFARSGEQRANPPRRTGGSEAEARQAAEIARVAGDGRSGKPVASNVRPATDQDEVKLLGVCSYTESSVRCWDTDGWLKKDLETLVDGALRSGNGFGDSTPMKYGSKNRFFIFTRPENSNVQYSESSSRDGGNLRPINFQRSSFGPQLDIVHASVFQGANQGSITAKLTQYSRSSMTEKSNRLLLQKGAKTKVNGVTFEFLSSNPVSANDAYAQFGGMERPKAKPIRVTVKITKPEDREYVIGISFIGESGQNISSVDENGKPFNDRIGYTPNGPRRYPAMQPIYSDDKQVSAIVYINPKFINSILVGATPQNIVEFKDIWLDPK